jgi:DNA polymerase III subunit delta'
MLLPWHEEPLAQLLTNLEKLPHAMLVQSPAGCGVEHFAIELAKALLCETPIAERSSSAACGQCLACNWFAAQNHPDYRLLVPEALAGEFAQPLSEEEGADDKATEVDGEKKKADSKIIKIEHVRAAMGFLGMSSHRGGRKVIVLFPADAMQAGAANALLKTLEEPPAGCHWILATSSPAKLLPTIRSRCRVIDLPMPLGAQAQAYMQEKSQMPSDAAAQLLAIAGGAPMRAIAMASDEERALFELIGAELERADELDAVAASQKLEKQPLDRIIYGLQTWVHDLLLAKHGAAPRFHIARSRWLAGNARSINLHQLFEVERRLAQAQRSVSHPLMPRLVIEQLLIAYSNVFRG